MRKSVLLPLKVMALLLMLLTVHGHRLQAQCQNPIVNGGFESGTTGWSGSISNSTSHVHSGSSAGQIHAFSPFAHIHVIGYQQFTVPTGGSGLLPNGATQSYQGTLSFWSYVDYNGYSNGSNFGGADVYIYVTDTNGSRVGDYILQNPGGRLDGGTYNGRLNFDLSAYSGQTLRLVVEAYTQIYDTIPGDNVADIWIDDVSINSLQKTTKSYCTFSFQDSVRIDPVSHQWVVYTHPGTYIDTLAAASVLGCDSIVETQINYSPVRYSQSVEYCPMPGSFSFTAGYHSYTATGTYRDTLFGASVSGCDSIVTTNIHTGSSYLQRLTYNFCDSGTAAPIGISHFARSNAVFYDTIFGGTIHGCDSVIESIVTVGHTPAAVPQVSSFGLCNGDSSLSIPLPLVDSNTTFVSWSSSNHNVGLNNIGIGDVPGFRAINNGRLPIIDTITATVKGRGAAWIPSSDIMYKFDLSTQTITDSILIPNGRLVQDIIISPDGSKIYALDAEPFNVFTSAGYQKRGLYTFSTSNRSLIALDSLITGSFNYNHQSDQRDYMRFSPDGNYLYVITCTRISPSTWFLHKYNTQTREDIVYSAAQDTALFNHNHSLAEYPAMSICLSPDGQKIYVGGEYGLAELNTANLTFSRSLLVTGMPASVVSLEMFPDGKRMLLGLANANISVLDVAADTVIQSLSIGGGTVNYVGAVRMSPDGNHFYSISSGNLGPYAGDISWIYEFDSKTYARTHLFNTSGYVPYLPALPGYYPAPEVMHYVNAFITPDQRNFYVHGSVDGFAPMSLIREDQVAHTGIYQYASYIFGTYQPLPTNHSNQSGSIGMLAAPGHCESTMSFTITIYPTARDTQHVTICQGHPYALQGHTYSTAGVYNDTLRGASMYGCDSIITTRLSVTPYARSYHAYSVCAGSTITAGGMVHSTTGYYSDTLHGAAATGCDSIIYTNLTVGRMLSAPSAAVGDQAVCTNSAVAAIAPGSAGFGNSIVWRGSTAGIGLAASGTGTVPAFTATNNTNAIIIDTITLTTVESGFAYVSNPNFDKVTVINRQTNTVVTDINGLSGASGIAVDGPGSRVYVAGQNVNNVSVIDASTNSVLRSIGVGTQPFNVAVNPTGNKVYTANYGSNNVSVIDTLTNTATATIPVGTNPRGIVVHPDGNRVYVCNTGSGSVSVINTQSNAVTDTIPVGSGPYGLSINATGTRVYVSNSSAGTVSVIDATADTLITNITVGSNPRGIAVTRDDSKVYVPDFVTSTVAVIDAATNTLAATIPVGFRPTGVSIGPDGNTVYVTCVFGGVVSVISTATNTVTGTISGLPGPDCIGSFTSGSGCSSAPVSYTISVKPLSHYTQQINLCAGDSLSVGTHTYHTTGIYNDTLASASVLGCDSIVTTQLTMRNPVTATISATVCQGSSYAGHSSSGTFTDHYSSIFGCDSARTLNLTVNPNVTDTIRITRCQGSSYAGHTTSGTYTDHYTSASGCDSARTLILTVTPNVTTTLSAAVCSGSSYAGHTASGTYTDHYTSAAGCDSARTLNLTVYPQAISTNTVTICGSSYTVGAHTYYFSGSYIDTLSHGSATGCDSIVTTQLTINNPTIWWRDADGDGDGNAYVDSFSCTQPIGYVSNSDDCNDSNAAVNSHLTWYIDNDGDGYGSTSRVYHGCDPGSPFFVLDSTDCDDNNNAVHASYNFYTDNDGDGYGTLPLVSICAVNASTAPAGYSVNNLDCNDAIFNATVPQSSSSISDQSICPGSLPYMWNGLTFSTAGSQTAHLTNSGGCDSAATLNLTVNPVTSSSTSLTITASALPYVWNGLTFTTGGAQTAHLLNSHGCDSAATLVLTVSTPVGYTWTGAVSTVWSVGGNWSGGAVPTQTSNAIIPGGLTRYPVISTTAEVNNLTIASGASVTVSSGQTVQIFGNLSNSGAASLGTGTVVLKGTTTFSGYSAFTNLTVAGNAIVGPNAADKISVNAKLTKLSGTLNTNNKLTLISTSTQTALIADSGGSLTGTATIQRYIPGSLGYHEISSPLSGATVANLAGFSISGSNGVGGWIHNMAGTLDDYRESANIYNTLDSGYYNYTSASNPLTSGKGLTALINGGVTISFTGVPSNGNINFNVTNLGSNLKTAGWNLIGNPYPSPVRWSFIRNANPGVMNATCYLWKPTSSTTGTWQAYNGTYGTNGVGDLIALGQGFFILKTASGTTPLSFNNAMRTVDLNPVAYKSNVAPDEIRLTMTEGGDVDNSNEILVYTEPGKTPGFDEDADALLPPAIPGTNANNLAFVSQDDSYLINAIDNINETLELPLAIHTTNPGTYTISAASLNVNAYPVYILDKNTNTYYEIATKDVTFTSPGNEDKNNYSVVFSKKASGDRPGESKVNIWGTTGAIVVEQTASLNPSAIRITNLLGQEVAAMSTTDSRVEIPVDNNTNTIYLVSVKQNGIETIRKVMVR